MSPQSEDSGLRIVRLEPRYTFAPYSPSGDPSEAWLILVAYGGVIPACAARLSNGYAYVSCMS
jgi:hypothetical protein